MNHEFVEGGKIKLILGPMFSGKSTRLTETVRKYKYKNKKTVLISFSGDKRYSDGGKIVTHEKVMYDALVCKRLEDHVETAVEYDVIGIDEGQFFCDLVEFCEKLCLLGKIVIVSALSGNFKMDPFENVSKLISRADKIKLLRAYCYFCQKIAGFSLRTVPDQEEILIGAADAYRPACKGCYFKNGQLSS